MEVDEQSKRDVHEFHVTQQLCLVDRQNNLERLGLHQQALFHQHVASKRLLTLKALVIDDHQFLALTCKAAQLEFLKEAPFVNGFDQPGSFVPMQMAVSVNSEALLKRGCTGRDDWSCRR